MKLKRAACAATALALCAALAPAALADEDLPLLISPAPQETSEPLPTPGGGYETVITINGKPLEAFDFSHNIPGWGSETVTWKLTDLAPAPAGYVPMRAISQGDHGSCYWDQEGNQAWFNLGDYLITVSFTDMSVTVDDQPAEGIEAVAVSGVTYLPVSILNSLEGFEVVDNSADGKESYEIKTPNGTPLMALAYELMDAADIYGGSKTTAEDLEAFYGEAYGFKAEYVTECVGFMPMQTSPDTLILGKVAEGKTEELQAALEAYRQAQEDTFSWYLSHNLPKAENGKFVTSGEWFMFVIGEYADEAVTLFETSVKAMSEAE